MLPRFLSLVALAVLLCLPTFAAADEISLFAGDPAPPLTGDDWYAGTPIDAWEDGHVYVIEFWATWCGPCKESIPHLNELKAHYAESPNVHIIGVTKEPRDIVDGFQKDKKTANPIQYDIVCDEDASIQTAFMTAAGKSGIPIAFIVGPRGTVEWIGHPNGINKPLQAVIDGKWDPALVAQHEVLANQFHQAQHDQDWTLALQVLDQQLALHKTTDLLGNDTRHIGDRAMLLLRHFDADRAYSYAALVAAKFHDDAFMLNQISWTILDDADVEVRDLDLALEMTLRSNDLTEHGSGAYLDTLARAYYEMGQLDVAVEWQRQAVDALEEGGDPRTTQEVRETLIRYENELSGGGATKPAPDDA